MIITEKQDAKPICDVHHAPMQFARYEAANIQLRFHAHSCSVQGCTRVYQHGHGYHDIVIGGGVSFAKTLRKECSECHTTMYLAGVSPTEEHWECGQQWCEHRESVQRVEAES